MRLENLKIDDIGLCNQAVVRPTDISIRRVLSTLACWHLRARQREKLANLDKTARRDIGITEADVWREVRKPIWQR
jgi:uncharacterized protein YjiS (DUF1127 family)